MNNSSILEKPKIEEDFAKIWRRRKTNAFVVFTDISGSTHLSVADEPAYFEKCFCHILFANKYLTTNNRIIVKTIGDEVMLTEIFSRNSDAPKAAEQLIVSAIKFQKQLDKRYKIKTKMAIHLCRNVVNGLALTEEATKLRGMKEFKAHDGDIFGKDVNLAARMMSIADEGQILISDALFNVLRSHMRKQVIKNKKITISGQAFKIDIPMCYNFKGFQGFKKVLQVVYNFKRGGENLSTSGYKFLCLTFFNVIGKDNPENIRKVKEKIADIFSRRSYPYIFEKINGRTIPSKLSLPFDYDIGVLFRLQSYETYTMLYHNLKAKLGKDIISSFSSPVWDDCLTKFGKMSGKKYLSLWRTMNYENAYELKEDSLSKKQLLNLMVLGIYDNITVSKSYGDVKRLQNKFSDSEIAKELISFPVKVVYEKSLYQW